jgi:hypothetical protein
VTLVVTPTQAEALELACAAGRPRLVLRSGRDNQTIVMTGIRVGQLRGDPDVRQQQQTVPVVEQTPTTRPADPVVAVINDPFADRRSTDFTPAPEVRHVTLIRGGKESVVTIEVPPAPASSADADE